jgi:hypothetical protein
VTADCGLVNSSLALVGSNEGILCLFVCLFVVCSDPVIVSFINVSSKIKILKKYLCKTKGRMRLVL